MAPATRERRQADYSNVGVAGRKTGVTLKDSGARDEHGMMPMDSIFSSPEKPRASPQNHRSSSNGRRAGNGTLTEESMELTTNSLPEPAPRLSVPRSLPPRSRSPIKTSLGGSPRKSIGPTSTPPRLSNGTPSRIFPQDDPSTIVDIATESLAQSIERSPQRRIESRPPPSPLAAAKIGKAKQTVKKGRKRPFDFSPDPDEEASTFQQDASQQQSTADEEALINGDDSMDALPEDDASQQVEAEAATVVKGTKGKRGRTKAAINGKTSTKGKAPQEISKPAPKRSRQPDPEPSITADESSEIVPTKRRPGRPPKMKGTAATKPEVYREPSQTVDEGPSKPTKRSKKDDAVSVPSPSTKKRPPPSERDPNAQITSSQKSKPDSKAKGKGRERPSKSRTRSPMPPPPRPASVAGSLTSERGRPKPRSLQILRSATPAESDGARFTRSGRTTIKPIEYWRGERIVWTKPRTNDGGRVSLPGMEEVVRAEDLPAEIRVRTPRKGRQGPKRKRKRDIFEEEEEEEDDAQEDWEIEAGVLEGETMSWIPKEQRATEDVLEQIDLAIAPKGLSALTKEVKNQSFEYAKTITLPFFHSGMVDIPPHGEKRQKNSRKNHMVFWVFSGRVFVDVSGNEFSVGRGGMWQVPRGNNYSVTNPFGTRARIFFAQGCYMTETEGAEFEEMEAERQRMLLAAEAGDDGTGEIGIGGEETSMLTGMSDVDTSAVDGGGGE